jgi:hypothetical protein
MLFGFKILYSDYLTAEASPREAFYRIWLIQDNNLFSVKKESGSRGKAQDTREWTFDDFEIAEKFYAQKIRQKTNPNRKIRKYSRTSKAVN